MLEKKDAEQLFLEQLETIDRAIRHASGRGVSSDDAEDFASFVKLKLIDNDYAVIRRYERRSTFAAFISVVVQRLLLDYRILQWGKWRASAEARRLGDVAVTIETLLVRDNRTIDEVLPTLLRRWPELDRTAVEGIVHMLPRRAPRPRMVEFTGADERGDSWRSDADAVLLAERMAVAKRIEAVVRRTMEELDATNRMVFRLRFESAMSVVDIARLLRTEQKPLYRRIRRTLLLLRARLEAAGVTAADAEEILTNSVDLNFGFAVHAAITDTATGEDGE